jgi:hypothetical protein
MRAHAEWMAERNQEALWMEFWRLMHHAMQKS